LRLGRTVVSVHTKAAKLRKIGLTRQASAPSRAGIRKHALRNLNTMIDSALRVLPERRGTKQEITAKISELHEPHLQGRWETSVKQLLNIKYQKILCTFSLNGIVNVKEVDK
jgi:hypothetical protein